MNPEYLISVKLRPDGLWGWDVVRLGPPPTFLGRGTETTRFGATIRADIRQALAVVDPDDKNETGQRIIEIIENATEGVRGDDESWFDDV